MNIMKKNLRIFCLISAVLAFSIGCSSEKSDTKNESATSKQTQNKEEKQPDETFEVFHIMSYHQGWEWTEAQLQGFKDALANT